MKNRNRRLAHATAHQAAYRETGRDRGETTDARRSTVNLLTARQWALAVALAGLLTISAQAQEGKARTASED